MSSINHPVKGLMNSIGVDQKTEPNRTPATLLDPFPLLGTPHIIPWPAAPPQSTVRFHVGGRQAHIENDLVTPHARRTTRVEDVSHGGARHEACTAQAPSDRAARVRNLFPVGVVENYKETITVEDAVGGGHRRDAESMGRKKPVYWGGGDTLRSASLELGWGRSRRRAREHVQIGIGGR
ncbi:hypothetical protein B0H13DRAFT_2306958 [Mycena leptocephala]|nr:hypothetical protein B0H13DRAFT_2306958 [Mycena leptocephala]